MLNTRKPLIAATAVALTLCLASCSSSGAGQNTGSGTGTSSVPSTADPKLAALVPSAIRASGTLNVATDASYAPMEYFGPDNTTIVGADVELGTAMAAKLGLKASFQNVSFDTIIASLGTRYDIGMSSFFDNKAREKKVDMVDYFVAGTGFLIADSKNADLTSLASLCGKSVAVEKGTTQLDDATAASKNCKGSTISVTAFPDQNAATLAVTSGRADVTLADFPVAEYQAQHSQGKLEVTKGQYGTQPYGIATPRGGKYAGLSKALAAALAAVRADGTYAKILAKWGITAGAVTSFTINGAKE